MANLIVTLSLGAKHADGRGFASSSREYEGMDETHYTAMEAILHDLDARLLKIGISRCDEKKLKEITDAAGVDLP